MCIRDRVSAEAIDSYRAVTKSSESDMEATVTDNAPINTLNPMDNYGNTYKPMLYGDEMIILPVLWKMENKAETMAQHSFSLVYIDKEIQTSSTESVSYTHLDVYKRQGLDCKIERAFHSQESSLLLLVIYFSQVARFHKYSSGPCACRLIHQRQKANCTIKRSTPTILLAVIPN